MIPNTQIPTNDAITTPKISNPVMFITINLIYFNLRIQFNQILCYHQKG